MAETYYYRDQLVAPGKLPMEVNAFWKDYIGWDESTSYFLSQNFVTNAKSFTSAMATIALLDVAFKPNELYIKRSVDHSLVVSSPSPAIIYHSSTKELNEIPVTGSVLVTQNYFEKLDETEYDPKLMTDVRKYIQPNVDFRPLVSYGVHVVLMNATPNPMKLHLEVQIPHGSISVEEPLEAGQDIKLAAHGKFEYEYYFYFPEAGEFPHYPTHVSDYEDIIAYASPTVLNVRAAEVWQAKNIDTSTWSYVLTRGSQDDVLKKLATDPLDGLKVEILIPRLHRDNEFLKNVTDVMRNRHEYNERIWSVALLLGNLGKEDQWRIRLVGEYMSHLAAIKAVGDWFTSPLLTRRPRVNDSPTAGAHAFRYLEYFPLINARVHKANKNALILNDRFKAQYEKFLHLLSQKARHDVEDLLLLVVYLIAQDRIVDAKKFFAMLTELVSNSDMDGQSTGFQQIQYDYLHAYLSLCVEVRGDSLSEELTLDLDGIQSIVNKYRDYPVERWNQLFKDMRLYVDEIVRTSAKENSGTSDHEDAIMVAVDQNDDPAGATERGSQDESNKHVPITVDFTIGHDSQVTIHHRGVNQVIVEYYAIDAETMFSASPLTFSDQGEVETNAVAVKTQSNVSGSLFSQQAAAPVKADSTSYRFVKPNAVDRHTVERAVLDAHTLKVPVPEQYRNTNVMVSVSTVPPAATRTWRAYYSRTISIQCQEHTGTVKVVTKAVTGEDDGLVASWDHKSQPLRGAYVKVYAELKNGYKETVFWKDGYTDLIGRFDYVTASMAAGPLTSPPNPYSGSLFSTSSFGTFGTFGTFGGNQSNTTNSASTATGGGSVLKDVQRFVVFVDGGKDGCAVKTVPVPLA